MAIERGWRNWPFIVPVEPHERTNFPFLSNFAIRLLLPRPSAT